MARVFLQPSGDDGKETTLRLQGDYAAAIRMFDRIETEALRMADAWQGFRPEERRYVLRSGHALPLNARALPAGMTPEGSAFSQNCAGCTTGDTLRCLPLHVKEERTLACTQSANSGVDR